MLGKGSIMPAFLGTKCRHPFCFGKSWCGRQHYDNWMMQCLIWCVCDRPEQVVQKKIKCTIATSTHASPCASALRSEASPLRIFIYIHTFLLFMWHSPGLPRMAISGMPNCKVVLRMNLAFAPFTPRLCWRRAEFKSSPIESDWAVPGTRTNWACQVLRAVVSMCWFIGRITSVDFSQSAAPFFEAGSSN